ncbi:sporulation protein YqfD [Pradoshia eiseniae]|uniref:Sporulation protein YqfD n=1 Tax=Pradoshia eiseniae TaxID=2064768 RepID=A0A2S7N397_9BACI|nr:sporulation protein YqfD [Pradoshia eiseniae]PQD96465.1 sporulation protein YqfD [Pradoshia eiseniae]
MKNHWTNHLSGYVKVQVRGRGAARFINRLLEQKVLVWDVKNMGTETVVFYMKLEEVQTLRVAARKSECKVTFLERKGAPFFAKKLMKYSGLLVGLFLFCTLIFILSNVVWGIEIKGASPATEHEVRKALEDMDIKVGKLQFGLDQMEDIQKELSERVPAITWIGVQLKGTTFEFQVVEKKQPKEESAQSYMNLIAAKNATIIQPMVERGQGLVEKNQYVQKGDVLVSGFIGREDNKKFVGAKGKIMAETWYKTAVTVPLKTNLFVFNGDSKTKHTVKFWDFEVPVWGFGNPEFPEFEVEEDTKTFRFLGWKIPVSVHKKQYLSKEKAVRVYTEEEAAVQAEKMARQDVLKLAPDDATIIAEKILHKRVDNGKVKMTIHYQVLENIAIGQPMIQGD